MQLFAIDIQGSIFILKYRIREYKEIKERTSDEDKSL